ncbi:unnamed protein product [Urochloa decumbens]|uniref:FBD domain-containing protein n=1 Tax=Urochloa decumbens TaxID=240449 RepID=A0ABC9BZ46_9POAL
MGKKKTTSKRPRLAAVAEEAGSQQQPPANLDQTSRLTDDLLLEIITLLPTADGCRTQILSRRWRPLWHSASPIYKATVIPYQDQDLAVAILRTHRGPIRHFFLRWHYGAFKDHAAIDRLLRLPVLDYLPVMELSYAPYLWASRNNPSPQAMFRFSPTMRVLIISCDYGRIDFSMSDACCKVDFPQLEQLTLKHIRISETALHAFLSRCHVLQSLVLHHNIGYRCLRIISPTLRSLGITDGQIRDRQSQECQEMRFEEVVIENAPLLERLSPRDIAKHMKIRLVHAPKLKELGYLYSGDKTMVFKGVEPVSPTNAIRTVKILALNTVPNVDVIIEFLRCFPCVEKLNLVVTGRRIENAQRDVSLECLDAHLKNVQLTPYKGSKSQVQLINFFLSNAKVLKSMTFAGIRPEPSAKWIASQHENTTGELAFSTGHRTGLVPVAVTGTKGPVLTWRTLVPVTASRY